MKTIKFLLTGILVCFALLAQSQNMSSDISTGLKTGNVNLISKYFAKSVDVSMLSANKTCTSTEAAGELNKFFQGNTPKDFTPLHTGERTGSGYVIGKLITSTGEYRITYYIKKSENGNQINQLKVEKF